MTASQDQHAVNLTSDQVISRPPPSFESSAQELSPSVFMSADHTDRGDKNSVSYPDSSPLPEMSPFVSMQHGQLPTPQSPGNFAQYVPGVPYTPEHPTLRSPQMPQASLTNTSTDQRITVQRPGLEDTRVDFQPMSNQTVTPESSPFVRIAPRPHLNSLPHRFEPVTPKVANSSMMSESPIRSRLSSPFMAKLSIADRNAKARTFVRSVPSHAPEIRQPQVDEAVSVAFASNSRSPGGAHPLSTSPPTSPPIPQASLVSAPTAGGEMERIRQAMIQDQLAHHQEAESRRPDYLRRTKRTLNEAEPATLLEDERAPERERSAAVGIMESPVKGRRLKLFQETSEESFEESLMAGGYGRYRTAEWVRQPQPLTLVAPGPAGPSNVVSALEEAEEAPPSEKELKKRKRLAAFRREHSPFDGSAAKLFPVELEGRGRVLLDIRAEDQNVSTTPEPTPNKKKGGSRRRKKGGELSPKERKTLTSTGAGEPLISRPNWPDAEFPWRLRTEERADMAKAEDADRMRWIERFLDRDSDDEDDEEVVLNTSVRTVHGEALPSAQWGVVYDDEAERPVPSSRGRGKMVPLFGDPGGLHTHIRKRNAFFPSDPADARAALLSKKSVRTLSYRQQKRRKQAEDESDEEVCICHGIDDGRELVQCDGCQTWYHLQCIGIRNIAELGREEDPWFCPACEERNRSSTPEPEVVPRQPTLVPTDDGPRLSRSHDPPLFQSLLQDSPMGWNPSRIPKTPTRSGHEYDHRLSSGSTWIDSSRHGPSTPYHLSQSVRVYTSSTPGPFDGYSQYDESPFDPTSTPSRGIQFNAPFATPKNVWSSRPNGLFQTPSRASGRSSSSKTFGGPGTLSSTLDDSNDGHGGFWTSSLDRTALDDDSPVRRSKSGDGPKMRHIIDSPLASRSTGSLPPHLLEESPVMRSKGKGRLYEIGRGLYDDAS